MRSFFSKVKPDWNVTCGKEISSTLIPHLAGTRGLCDERFFNSIKRSNEYFFLSVEFDHWQDIMGRSVLAVVATFPDGARHLISPEDVTLRGHSSTSIIKSLKKSLSTVTPTKLNAIMSDNAASCKRARKRLIEEVDSPYKHLIEYRYQAHLFNLIGARSMKDEEIEELFTGANKLVSYISSNQKLQGLLTELGYRKLVKSTSVRWYYYWR